MNGLLGKIETIEVGLPRAIPIRERAFRRHQNA